VIALLLFGAGVYCIVLMPGLIISQKSQAAIERMRLRGFGYALHDYLEDNGQMPLNVEQLVRYMDPKNAPGVDFRNINELAFYHDKWERKLPWLIIVPKLNQRGTDLFIGTPGCYMANGQLWRPVMHSDLSITDLPDTESITLLEKEQIIKLR
jgi:hypothetical protein